ncbi:hypothetical protein Tco_1271877 [Tanacetum coccineum]
MTEAIVLARLHKKSEGRRWTFIVPKIHAWRDQKGEPNTYEIEESSLASHIKEIQDHLEEILLERVKTVEHELEILRDRAEAAE